MAESKRCLKCGSDVPADAAEGLCPNCALRAAFGTQQTDGASQAAEDATDSFNAQYVPPTPAELAPYFPDLEILELIGRGGMGVVYKARQKRLDRLVALKILAPRIGQDPAFAERFAREARAMAMLSHPHIVAVHDFGQTTADSGQWSVDSGQRREKAEGGREKENTLPSLACGRGAGGEGSQSDQQPALTLALSGHHEVVVERGHDLDSPNPESPNPESPNPESPNPESPNPESLTPEIPKSPNPQIPLFYFLMEFVDGVNLRRLLDTGKLAPEEALAIVPQICEALQYAHDMGVVHRDIKPENILIDKRGQVKIADFGIAKLVGKRVASGEWPVVSKSSNSSPQSLAPSPSSLTAAGQIIGTPQYMAPEQMAHPLQVDHRADIYSLGVVFYQMLTGELPIGQFAPPSNKVQIDVRLDEVVLRALEKEPQRRYQQANEIKTRVENILTTQPTPRSELPQAGQSTGSRTRGGSLLTPALFLLPPVVFLWFLLAGHRNFGIDLDADVQFYLGVAAFPLSAGLGAMLAWAARMLLPSRVVPLEPNAAGVGGWCWQAVAGIVLLILGLPFGGGAVVLLELSRHSGHSWHPSTPELVITLVIFGGAALLAAATTLLAVDSLRRIRRATYKLRGRAAMSAIAWFWPVMIIETLVLMVMPAASVPLRGPTLIYELESETTPYSNLIGKTSSVINQRLGKGSERLAHAMLRDNGLQFAVAVIAANDAARQRVERLLGTPGTLEFHILADARHNKAIVEKAMNAPAVSELFDSSGKKIALWVPVKTSEERKIENIPGIVWRTVKQEAGEVRKVLVLPDTHNLTGGYLSQVEAATDRQGRPCLRFLFCPAGAQLLAKLTGDHLPDKTTGLTYKLGMILDGELWSWPQIMSPISDRCELVGSFTQEEISDMARILNAGALPVSLRLVQVVQHGMTPVAKNLTPTALPNDTKQAAKLNIPWGDWNIGWSVRLRAEKTEWSTDELPEFMIDLRKHDKGEPDVVRQSLQNWLLQVDDQRFCLSIFSTAWEHNQVFEPGTTREKFLAFHFHRDESGLHVRTGANHEWINSYSLTPVGKDGHVLSHPKPQDQLRWTPGKHMVRIAFPMGDIFGNYTKAEQFAFSNPVDIEIEDKASTETNKNTIVAEVRPELRFLAWQDERQQWSNGRVWHADGTPVEENSELRLPADVFPPLLSIKDNAELVKQRPRFLDLWFSHPGIDKQSYAAVTLLDAAGNPLPLAVAGMMGSSAAAPGPNTDKLGWITYALSPGVEGETPTAATIRLQYSAGPWTKAGRIEPDYRGVMSLPGNATLSGIGQNSEGKPFVSIAKDITRGPAMQLDFFAVTKDGRDLSSTNVTYGGPSGGPVRTEQFEFDVPFNEIKEFRIRTRPIKSVDFKNVSLQPETQLLSNIQPLDLLQVRTVGDGLDQSIDGFYLVEPDGRVALGPLCGRINVNGLTLPQAEEKIRELLIKTHDQPKVQVTLARRFMMWHRAEYTRVPFTIGPLEVLNVRARGTQEGQPIDGFFLVESAGTIPFGPAYGRVQVGGLTLEAAEEAIKKQLEQVVQTPEVQVTLPSTVQGKLPGGTWRNVPPPEASYKIATGELLYIDAAGTKPGQPIRGIYLVEPMGTVALGPAYGRAKVEGLSLEEAQQAIEKKLREVVDQPAVSVTLAGWVDEAVHFLPGTRGGSDIKQRP